MNAFKTFGAIAALTMAITGATAAAARPVETLSLRDAVTMAAGATAAAERGGLAVSIVIVNAEGRVILSQRMDGASFKSLDVAEGKATTSAALRAPTQLLEQGLAKGDHSVLSVPNIVAIGGGIPVIVDQQAIAAIGISGGTPQQDADIAAAGRAALSRK